MMSERPGLRARFAAWWPRVRRPLAAGGVAVLALALWVRCWPVPDALLAEPSTPSTVVVDRHGAPIYEALSGEATRAIALRADALPPRLVAATLAAEDRRFFSHVGIDPVAVVRALRHHPELNSTFDAGNFHARGFDGNDKMDHCAHIGLLRDVFKSHIKARWKTPKGFAAKKEGDKSTNTAKSDKGKSDKPKVPAVDKPKKPTVDKPKKADKEKAPKPRGPVASR